MPRALPGAKGAEGYAGLLLEQMQESRGRQIDGSGAIGRGHLAAGEIIELCGGAPDAAIDVAIRQNLANKHQVEFTRRKAAAALPQAQGLVSGANTPGDVGRVSAAN